MADLRQLKINEENKLTLDSLVIEAVPVGAPQVILISPWIDSEFKARFEGLNSNEKPNEYLQALHKWCQDIEIPKIGLPGANAYVLSDRLEFTDDNMHLVAIQFYHAK